MTRACMCAQVRQLYTAPTLIRSLEAQDDAHVTGHDRSSLRVLGTVGEPSTRAPGPGSSRCCAPLVVAPELCHRLLGLCTGVMSGKGSFSTPFGAGPLLPVLAVDEVPDPVWKAVCLL